MSSAPLNDHTSLNDPEIIPVFTISSVGRTQGIAEELELHDELHDDLQEDELHELREDEQLEELQLELDLQELLEDLLHSPLSYVSPICPRVVVVVLPCLVVVPPLWPTVNTIGRLHRRL